MDLTRNSMVPNRWHRVIVGCISVGLTACGIATDNEARLQRAADAFERGDFRSVIVDTRRVLQDEPNSKAARTLLGRAALRSGDAPTAVKEFGRALQLGATPASIGLEFAEALLANGEYDEAIALIAGDPDLAASPAGRRLIGSARLELGQIDASRQTFLELTKSNTASPADHVGLVSTFIRERAWAQARSSLAESLERFPDDGQLRFMSARVHLESGDAAQAESEFELAAGIARTAEASDLLVDSLIGLTDALLAQDERAAAEQVRQEVADIAVADPRVRLLEARVLLLEGRVGDAQSALEGLARQFPDFAPAQRALGLLLLAQNQSAEAESYFAAALALQPGHRETRQLLADARLDQGEAAGAQAALEPLLDRSDATDKRTAALAARAGLARGDREQALDYFRRAVGSADAGDAASDLAARLALAAALARQGDDDEALKLLSEVAEQEPDDPRANVLAADVLAKNGATRAEAARRYTEALAAAPSRELALHAYEALGGAESDASGRILADYLDGAPGDTEARLVLAQYYQDRSDWSKAASHYERVLETTRDDFVALNNLAWVYHQASDSRALDTARRAYAASGEHPAVADTLGWILLQQGAVDQALPLLEHAHLTLDDPSVAYHFAVAASSAGDTNRAAGLLRQILSAGKSFPETSNAQVLLDRIEKSE